MTVYKMAKSGKFKEKNYFIIRWKPKKTNDWCFANRKVIGNHPFQKNGLALFANADFKRNLIAALSIQ
jgi:hypothetical protein